MRCLALDIGGTKIAAAIVENGQVTQRQQLATPQQDSANGMHEILARIVQSYADQFDYVAVASTGIINNGVLTALNPKNLGGLAEFPLVCLTTCRRRLVLNINSLIKVRSKISFLLRYLPALVGELY